MTTERKRKKKNGQNLSHPNTSFPTIDERSICSSTRNITKKTPKRRQKRGKDQKNKQKLTKMT
jgi:hypothetical protein